MEKQLKNYNKWMKKVINDHFRDLNKNCISNDKYPGSLYKWYTMDTSSNTTPFLIISKNLDVYNLNCSQKINQSPINVNSHESIMRFNIETNIQTYEIFKLKVCAAIIENIKYIVNETGVTKNDYIMGNCYLSFNRPGFSNDEYLRSLEDPRFYELRGYSSFCKI